MKAFALLLIAHDVLALLISRGILTMNGFDHSKVDTLQEDAEVAAAVAAILERYGLNVPDRVEKVLAMLPLIAGFIR